MNLTPIKLVRSRKKIRQKLVPRVLATVSLGALAWKSRATLVRWHAHHVAGLVAASWLLAISVIPPRDRARGRLVFMGGLDNAGKTTLLNMLETGRLSCCHPTLYPNRFGTVSCGGALWKTFDLGGYCSARRLWADYVCVKTEAVVFIVDVGHFWLRSRGNSPLCESETHITHSFLAPFEHMQPF